MTEHAKLQRYGYTIRGFHTSLRYPCNLYADLRDADGTLLMSATIERCVERLYELCSSPEEPTG